jgi:hypothetical protein
VSAPSKAMERVLRRVADRERRVAAGPPALTYLSLGAGVQSTALALMVEHGLLPKPDLAIFADTQWEPAHVYRHLDWLVPQLSFPVVRVTAGNLREHVIHGVKKLDRPDGSKRDPYRGIPVYTRQADGHLGMARRQCTREFKITPIMGEVRRQLGLAPGQRVPRNTWVRQWTGISTDEAHRAKPAEEAWLSREYPLLDLRMTRAGCLTWMRDHGYPDPPKSSCIGCPFHGATEWHAVRADPVAWADAVEVDRAIRGSLNGLDATECFLHWTGRPLEDVIVTAAEAGQQSLFGNECDGVCGV